MSTQGGLNIVTDGLVFQVDAANKLGGNVSNVNSIVKPTDTGIFTNGASVVNDAYFFDGVNDYINLGALDSLETSINTTFSFWVNLVISAGSHGLYVRGSTTEQDDYLSVTIRSPNIIEVAARWASQPIGNYNRVWNSSGVLTTNTWHNVVVTKEPDTALANVFGLKMYLDATFVSSNIVGAASVPDGVDLWFPDFTGANEKTTFGAASAHVNRTGNFTDGQIANCNTYDRTLTPTEISKNYESQKHNFE